MDDRIEPGTVPQKVFELTVHDSTNRITIYRSERIPDLYPQTYFRTPNGIGSTLLARRNGNAVGLSWAPSPMDASHDAAEYYIAYASAAATAGFAMTESSAQPTVAIPGNGTIEFYKIVAANLAGTSGDAP